MRMTWLLRAASALVFCQVALAALTALPAHAESGAAKATDAETLAAARAVAIEGVKLARAGYCHQAIEQLERAEALHHSSIVLAELGECYLRTGRVVAASEALRHVTREALPEIPTSSQIAARARAELLLSDALARVARLTIVIFGPQLSDATLTIDERVVSSALIGVARPTDPGPHRVVVSAPGFNTDSAELTLSPGETQSLTLNLEAAQSAPQRSVQPQRAARGFPPALPADSKTNARDASPALRAGYSLLGVGAAGLALGAGFGGAALRLKLQLDDRCTSDSCPPSARADLDHAKRWALASTVSFALGGVSAAIGAILVALEKRERPRRTAAWTLDVGPGIGLATRGRF